MNRDKRKNDNEQKPFIWSLWHGFVLFANININQMKKVLIKSYKYFHNLRRF